MDRNKNRKAARRTGRLEKPKNLYEPKTHFAYENKLNKYRNYIITDKRKC